MSEGESCSGFTYHTPVPFTLTTRITRIPHGLVDAYHLWMIDDDQRRVLPRLDAKCLLLRIQSVHHCRKKRADGDALKRKSNFKRSRVATQRERVAINEVTSQITQRCSRQAGVSC